MIEIKVFDSSSQACSFVHELILRKLRDARQKLAVAIPTGKTPIKLYSMLAESIRKEKLNDKAVWFGLDEVYSDGDGDLPPFRKFLLEKLVLPAGIPQELLVTFRTDCPPQQSISEYLAELAQFGRFDLALLGIGKNGHIAFNEPGTEWKMGAGIRKLSKQSIDSLDWTGAKVLDVALSIGIKEILEAKQVVVLAFGKSKAQAVKLSIEGKPDKNVPASCLQNHPDCKFVLDKEAASLLGRF